MKRIYEQSSVGNAISTALLLAALLIGSVSVYDPVLALACVTFVMGMTAQMATLRVYCQPWLWPLPNAGQRIRQRLGQEYDGSFGFRRKHEVHTGVDIYCEVGQEVRAVADGRVLLVTDFTGEKAGSPWWYPTQAVLVEHGGRVVVYGEIVALVQNDAIVRRGEVLGKVLRVRKEDDKPTTMLHLELWRSVDDVMPHYTGASAAVANDWPLDGKRPKGLLDPTKWLKNAED